MDDIITRLRHLADYITAASGYTSIEKPMKSGWDEIMRKAATAIEELAAQVKDKDYLIQQQTEEIQLLQRDVKKQQEKMIELAKTRELKEMEEVKTFVHQRGAVVVDYDIYEMLIHNYGREPKRGKWIDTVTAGIEETVCSVCRCSGFRHFKYCPGCGAEMEGVK